MSQIEQFKIKKESVSDGRFKTGEVKFIDYKGKEILILDFAHCQPDKVIEILEEGRRIVKKRPLKSVRSLADVTGARYNKKVISTFKEVTAANKPYVIKSAVVGATGMKKLIYKSIMKFSRRDVPLFDTLEEAKDFLACD